MATVLMPLANGFEEIEALAVVDILRRGGVTVVMAGLSTEAVEGAHDIMVIPDTLLPDVNASSFDMIILPGGQPGTDNLNASPLIHGLLQEFHSQGTFICAICAAPIVLAQAGLLEGKRTTCYPSYGDHLRGGIFIDLPVVIDGTVITSRGPGTAIPFGLTLLAQLMGAGEARRVAQAMLVPEMSFF